MIYKDFQGLKLSALGLGTMRLPLIDHNEAKVDREKTAELVDYAMENGINYYDTAWVYHGGTSESVMGEILSRYPRDSYFLATKFPGFDLKNILNKEEIFEAQLKHCQTDHFDFYLIHNVNDDDVDNYLNPDYGVVEFLLKKKEEGKIRHLGFSTHSSKETFERFLTAYGDKMEFCQIQLNYMDWTYQDARAKVELLNELQIPIWVMEPLRGGRLAHLTEKDEASLKALRPEETIPAWGFRFIQDFPTVGVTLSGMSTLEQLEQNIKIFSEEKPLNDSERGEILSIADEMISQTVLPCTACHYCTTNCPMGLDIPYLISYYNDELLSKHDMIDPFGLEAFPKDKWPSACLGCRSCEKECPQQIHISEAMADFAKRVEMYEQTMKGETKS